MSVIGTIYEDVTTDVLGFIGTWQWVFTILATTITVPTAFNQYENMISLKPSLDITCDIPEEIEIINSSLCYFTLKRNVTTVFRCAKWHVNLLWFIAINKTWLIFCENQLMLLSTMICRLGLIFGCIIFGVISDSFGRKKVTVINVIAEFTFRLILTFCDSEAWYRLLIFLKALLSSANLFMTLVMICEIASNAWRTILMFIVSLPRVLAMVCSTPLANNLANDETVNFIICSFSVLCMVLLRWLPESPQWLLHSRKIPVAENILSKAAKKNGIKLCSDFKIRPVNREAYNCLDEPRTCISILSIYNTRVLVICCMLSWALYNFLWSLIYIKFCNDGYNLSTLETLSFFALFGIMSMLLSKKLKVKHLLIMEVIVMGTLSGGVLLMSWFQIKTINYGLVQSAALAFGMIGQALLLIITPRLFAIHIRATIFGCCHSTGQFGAMMSYLIHHLDDINDVTLLSIQVATTFMLIALWFVFPDVDGRELPDAIEDMDFFSELSKPIRWTTQKTNSPSLEEVEMRVYSFGSAGHNLSTHDTSVERLSAQPIGFKKMWNRVVLFVRQKLRQNNNQA